MCQVPVLGSRKWGTLIATYYPKHWINQEQVKMKNQTFTPREEPPVRRRSHAVRLLIPSLLLLALTLFIITSTRNASSPKELPTATEMVGNQSPLESLLYSQLPDLLRGSGRENWVLDDVLANTDNTQVMLWMREASAKGEESLSREPEMVLAIWNAEKQTWSLHLTTDDDFVSVLQASDFKDTESASRFLEGDPKGINTGIVYGGYKLPWKFGQTKRLTWSVGHSSCSPSYYCNYAFDFADGTMFEILAAKGGYVYHWRDTCANGNSSCTNSITLEDRSTTPWTYQIYMHIAQGSIPTALKTKGVHVSQGQLIAKTDDTGYSTGHHLHFMVVEKSTLNSCPYYCFGKAVDITFKDVEINWDAATQGGRPRLAAEAEWYGGTGRTNYTSGNVFTTGVYIARFVLVWH